VHSVISLVPGVGSGISAALGAAQALADGRPIDEAIVAGVRTAISGGPMAEMAFDAAWGLAHGRPIDSTVLSTLRERLPTGFAQRAFDNGLPCACSGEDGKLAGALSTAPHSTRLHRTFRPFLCSKPPRIDRFTAPSFAGLGVTALVSCLFFPQYDVIISGVITSSTQRAYLAPCAAPQ